LEFFLKSKLFTKFSLPFIS